MLNLVAGMALIFVGSPQVAYAQSIEPLPMVEQATTTEGIVRAIQAQYGLGEDFYKTASCESDFTARAKGDYEGAVPTSFGVFQIHLPAHREITREQAMDPLWASRWAAGQFIAGNARIWTCYRMLKKATP